MVDPGLEGIYSGANAQEKIGINYHKLAKLANCACPY